MDTKIRKVEAMDQRLQQIEQELKEFKEAIEDISPTDGVWLFGSQVSGKQKEYSDIDVAVVSAGLNQNYWDKRKKIVKLGMKINDSFELHLFSPEEFANPYDPLVAEIKKYGVRI